MINLLKYYIKERLHILAIVSAIMIIFIFAVLFDIDYIFKDGYGNLSAIDLPYWIMPLFSVTLTIIFVIGEFSFKMNKITVDQLYSLPIKKYKLFIVKYIVGLLEILIPLTIGFITMMIMIISKPNVFDLSLAWLFYLGIVGFTIIMYTSYAFVYTRCNSIIDGIMNMVLWTLLLTLVIYSISVLYSTITIHYNNSFFGTKIDGFNFTLMSPIIYFTTIMSRITSSVDVSKTMEPFIISAITMSVLGIIMGVLFFTLVKKEKSEDAGQVCKSLFSYTTLIPMYIFFGILIMINAGYIGIVIVLISGYLLYVVKNRSFVLNKKDLIIFISVGAAAIVLHILIDIWLYYFVR